MTNRDITLTIEIKYHQWDNFIIASTYIVTQQIHNQRFNRAMYRICSITKKYDTQCHTLFLLFRYNLF